MRDQGQEKHANPVHISELLKMVDVEKLAGLYIKENLGLLVQDMPAWKAGDVFISVDKNVTKESVLEAIAAKLQ